MLWGFATYVKENELYLNAIKPLKSFCKNGNITQFANGHSCRYEECARMGRDLRQEANQRVAVIQLRPWSHVGQ